MSEPSQKLFEELNALIATHAHAFTDLQCHVRYTLHDIREMVDVGVDRAEILHCIDEYEAQIKSRVLTNCSLSKVIFAKLNALLAGLEPPPIEQYVLALKAVYGKWAGWK